MIQTWIKCGMYAPSAGNEQPWHFIIIKNPEKLHEIPRFHNHASMLHQASLAILVCIDPKLEKHSQMAIQDCAAATQNMLLAIHEQNYGAVWLGVYPRETRMKGLRSLFNIPEEIIPFSLIAIGKPDEKKTVENRFKTDRIHYDQW
jgi:nitroreductase